MLLNVLRCHLTYLGQAETSAEAWFNIALRPQKQHTQNFLRGGGGGGGP